jgi:hypothetical protein
MTRGRWEPLTQLQKLVKVAGGAANRNGNSAGGLLSSPSCLALALSRRSGAPTGATVQALS